MARQSPTLHWSLLSVAQAPNWLIMATKKQEINAALYMKTPK